MELTGEPDGPPQSVGDNIGDSVPGLWTALGIVLALETRRRTGRGQYVDMAMYECMVSHIESNMNHYQSIGSGPGRSRERLATAGMTFGPKDGYVVLAGARSAERMRTLWDLLGRADLAEDKRFLGQGMEGEFYHNEMIPAIEEWSVHRTKLESPQSWWTSVFPWGWPRLSRSWPTALTWRAAACSSRRATPLAALSRVTPYIGPAHRLPGVAG